MVAHVLTIRVQAGQMTESTTNHLVERICSIGIGCHAERVLMVRKRLAKKKS
jgi:hypothetical protein